MASAFAHALIGLTAKRLALPKASFKVTMIAMFCAAIPDADVLAFKFGIPYEHMFGHRGFTHSVFFGILFGLLLALIFHWKNKDKLKYALLYIFCTTSHGIVDAFTNGGRGIALLAPFTDERFFAPWRVIQVSPISIRRFFTEWGWVVIQSEMMYIGIPCLLLLGLGFIIHKK